MKKYITVILVLSVLFSHDYLHAQTNGRLAIGPKFGYNFSKVNLDNATTVNGSALGITTEYWLNTYSIISLDIIHSSEGYEVPTAVIDYTYLQLPILYNLVFGTRGQVLRPKLNLGFSPGFILNSEINGVDFKAQTNSTIVNLVGGIGTLFNLSERLGLHIEARAFVGLTSPELNNSPDPVKNRTFQIAIASVYGL